MFVLDILFILYLYIFFLQQRDTITCILIEKVNIHIPGCDEVVTSKEMIQIHFTQISSSSINVKLSVVGIRSFITLRQLSMQYMVYTGFH